MLVSVFVCSICEGQFVRDATYPDGSAVAPGVTINKTWIMRNTGSVPWTPTSTKARCFIVSIKRFFQVLRSKNLCVTGFFIGEFSLNTDEPVGNSDMLIIWMMRSIIAISGESNSET